MIRAAAQPGATRSCSTRRRRMCTSRACKHARCGLSCRCACACRYACPYAVLCASECAARMQGMWPGIDVSATRGGHVSASIFHQDRYVDSIVRLMRRL